MVTTLNQSYKQLQKKAWLFIKTKGKNILDKDIFYADLPIVPMVPRLRAPRLRGAPLPPVIEEKKLYERFIHVDNSLKLQII